MLSPEQTVAALNAMGDQLTAHCLEHERETHDGEVCWTNRMSALAFLAHRIGFKTRGRADWVAAIAQNFITLVQEYEYHCPGCNADSDENAFDRRDWDPQEGG